ncbi:non-specific lipid-transfer protein-like isoform X1 [Spinacia oleracea]|uniref:Non-specific lipid-transfer protein n=1 Tax=Spinacia oleracea TaxID=3562 RepID=A0ABM3QSB0_SPIOL|nr:non-specific lipid-transfer protein-like isoform X1 [Spinacia oleracea]
MARSTVVKLACAAVVIYIVVVAPHAEAAITSCNSVLSNVTPCLAYLRGATAPNKRCCDGVNAVNDLAVSVADQNFACRCIKNFSGDIMGIDYSKIPDLPGKCGIGQFDYPITDKGETKCNNMHGMSSSTICLA